MHDIECPHCGKAFTIDEAGYADILNQVRDEAFEKAIHDRLELAEREKLAAVELARMASALQDLVRRFRYEDSPHEEAPRSPSGKPVARATVAPAV